jgi:hypothetical protein
MMVEPIDIVALTAVILGCLMFLIPIAGLTARFALKPITEALAKGREGGVDREALQLLERRLSLLEQEVHSVSDMRGEVSRLVQELEFHKQLAEGQRR